MQQRRPIIIGFIIFLSILVFLVALANLNSNFRSALASIVDLVHPANLPEQPIHAVHVEFSDYDMRGSQGAVIDFFLPQTKVNLVSLTAGRVEWTFFKWPAHPEFWSSDVTSSGTDFLASDSAHFKKYGKVDAEIDALSPNYIKAHPETAAIDAFGKASTDLVGLIELTQGNYGKLLENMLTYVASNYPNVNSISITELTYRLDGYGPDEKTSYLQFSHQKDWPRNSDGSIAIDDPAIIQWRSQLLGDFIGKLTAIAHAHGKQLYLDVSSGLDGQLQFANESGVDFGTMLQKTDKLVVWCYYSLDGNSPEAAKTAALYLKKYDPKRIILSIGLWGPNNSVMDANSLQQGVQLAQQGGIVNFWITPSTLMKDSHWEVMATLWK
jgi:hypothetical protein